MGLIKAALGAIGGTLADQWKEYIYCDSMSADVLVQKGEVKIMDRSSNTRRNDNIISDGSKIAVNEGQFMMIVENGKVVDFSAEPGAFTYRTGTEPSMLDNGWKGLKESFKMVGKRSTYGGQPENDQRVYYVNIKEIMDNKVGVGDVLIGASAVAADYNGVAKASHVKDKLIEMIHLNETMYSCGIACSAEGTKTASGNYLIDLLLANVCKQNVTRFPYEMARIAEDLAGGSVGTCLSEADLRGEFTGPWVAKYMKNGTGTTAENRMRILRLIENLSLGSGAVGYRTESLHGAGSPQAQRVMIARQGDIEGKKKLSKRIAHVKED